VFGRYQQICVARLALRVLGTHSPPLYSRPLFRTIDFSSTPDIADRRALHTVRSPRLHLPAVSNHRQVNSSYFTPTSTLIKQHTQPPKWGESTPPASRLWRPPTTRRQPADDARSKEKMHINVVVIGHVDSGKSTTTGRKPAPPCDSGVTTAHIGIQT
jgi:hypothetical protein